VTLPERYGDRFEGRSRRRDSDAGRSGKDEVSSGGDDPGDDDGAGRAEVGVGPIGDETAGYVTGAPRARNTTVTSRGEMEHMQAVEDEYRQHGRLAERERGDIGRSSQHGVVGETIAARLHVADQR